MYETRKIIHGMYGLDAGQYHCTKLEIATRS